MPLRLEDVSRYLGQPIYDVYGRRIGILVGVYSEVDGTVTAVEVSTNDSIYETIPAERLEPANDGLKIVPEWLIKARSLEKKLDVIRKRIRALEELYAKKEIPEHAYNELKEKLSKELDKARSESKTLKEDLRKRKFELENFVLHIEKAMTNLMVSYTAGELPEEGFKNSINLLRYAKQLAMEEKKDIEKHLETLTKLEEEIEKALATPSEEVVTLETSQGPIVVKVIDGVQA